MFRRIPRTRQPLRPSALLPLVLVALLAASGCGDGPSEPSVDGLEIADVVLEMADGEVVYSHIDHWHGFAVVEMGDPLQMTVHFVARSTHPDDHDVASRDQWFTLEDHPEYGLQVVVEDPALAAWSGDRVGGTLTGSATGNTRASFVVRRGTTTIYEAPPVNVVVR